MTDYDFRSLSPIDFEAFSRDLVNQELGLHLETFALGRDGGIDIRDSTATPPLIGQCKHRPDLTGPGLLRVVRSEIARWAADPPSGYLFITSASVSPQAHDIAQHELNQFTTQPEPLWLRGRLNATLACHRDVERRHFKLWLSSAAVFEAVLERGEWQHSEALLRRVRSRIRLHVETPAVGAAFEHLDTSSLVVITGDPGVGKSTLAEMLLLQHWWEGWTVVNLTSWNDESWKSTTPERGRVILYYDDFLGQTSFAEVAKNEASSLQLLMDHVRRNPDRLRLILTTRSQVLAQARTQADDRIRRLPIDPVKTQVNLRGLTRSMKARMLFNHLYFATLESSSPALEADLEQLIAIIDHDNFNPRLLESAIITSDAPTLAARLARLTQVLDDPTEVWDMSFEQLPNLAADLLMQLALVTGPWPVDDLYTALGQNTGRHWQPALKQLDDAWVTFGRTLDGRTTATLFDGSRRDFLAKRLADPALLDRVISQASSLTQLQYLIDAATVPATSRAPHASPDGELRRLIRRRITPILQRAEVIAADAFHAAYEDFRERQAGNARRSAATSWRFDERVFQRLLDECLANARLIDAAPAAPPQLIDTFERQCERLLELVHDDAGATDSLFQLADAAYSINPFLSTRLAHRALDNGDFLESVTAFEHLNADLREAVLEMPISRERLTAALQNELDNVTGFDAPSAREEVLDEIDRYAALFDVPIDTDWERERLETYTQQYIAGPRSRVRPQSGETDDGDVSDDDLRRMFALLGADSQAVS